MIRHSAKSVPAGRTGVMHLTDTLDAGGAERVAVNLVNLLPRQEFSAHLCTTRRDGPLGDLVTSDVKRLRLDRTQRFDLNALRKMTAYIRQHRIQILHAHGSSVFAAILASLFPPHATVIWHDHYGINDRSAWLYRFVVKRVEGVIAVNQPLLEWSIGALQMPSNRVWLIPNFVCPVEGGDELPSLPGREGKRIICVANIRPVKDHLTLVRAMKIVVEKEPQAHLLLVGAESDPNYADLVKAEISRSNLTAHISFLGQRRDVFSILKKCDIGVLTSTSEGLPLSLLEYGMAHLSSIATRVGECAEVMDKGRAGVLLPPNSPAKLAEELLELLASPVRRILFGELFFRHVHRVYSPTCAMQKICQVYRAVLRERAANA